MDNLPNRRAEEYAANRDDQKNRYPLNQKPPAHASRPYEIYPIPRVVPAIDAMQVHSRYSLLRSVGSDKESKLNDIPRKNGIRDNDQHRKYSTENQNRTLPYPATGNRCPSDNLGSRPKSVADLLLQQ